MWKLAVSDLRYVTGVQPAVPSSDICSAAVCHPACCALLDRVLQLITLVLCHTARNAAAYRCRGRERHL